MADIDINDLLSQGEAMAQALGLQADQTLGLFASVGGRVDEFSARVMELGDEAQNNAESLGSQLVACEENLEVYQENLRESWASLQAKVENAGICIQAFMSEALEQFNKLKERQQEMLLEINEGLESVGSTLVEVTHQCQEAEEGIDTSLDGLDGSFEQFAATLEGRLAACGQSHHDLTEQLSAFVEGTDQYVKAVNQETDGLVEQLGAMIGGLEEPLQTIFANSVEPEIGEFLDAVDGLEFAIVETENQIISLIENDLEVATNLRDFVNNTLEKATNLVDFCQQIDQVFEESEKISIQ